MRVIFGPLVPTARRSGPDRLSASVTAATKPTLRAGVSDPAGVGDSAHWSKGARGPGSRVRGVDGCGASLFPRRRVLLNTLPGDFGTLRDSGVESSLCFPARGVWDAPARLLVALAIEGVCRRADRAELRPRELHGLGLGRVESGGTTLGLGGLRALSLAERGVRLDAKPERFTPSLMLNSICAGARLDLALLSRTSWFSTMITELDLVARDDDGRRVIEVILLSRASACTCCLRFFAFFWFLMAARSTDSSPSLP